MNDTKIYSLHMGPATCAVDLGDGSERGEYVNQDYVLNKIGRPHRGINLMYCYYPLDKGWPVRASVAFEPTDKTNAWAYPYDDYFPYEGGLNGNKNAEVFNQIRDIRRHGQDVVFTLTADPHISDEHIIAIANDMKPFGRVLFRLNHEATGSWFSFNKRCTYQEVADFFVRFTNIMHEHAPNVKMILCIGGVENLNEEKIVMEEIFSEAVRVTDIWSVDKYMALHWGWPHDVADKGGHSHSYTGAGPVYDMTKASYERFKYICGGTVKPMVMSEFNADGDVTGPYDQCKTIRHYCDKLIEDNATWFSGLTFYQFRDRGRLGLEWEDPNNPEVGIELPALKEYKQIINQEWFMPKMEMGAELTLPATLRWGGAEDAEGIAVPVHLEKDPVFCELHFSDDDDSNLMIECNGRWFYKSPKCKFVDLMPAFFENRLEGEKDLTVKFFAPPASGENDLSIDGGDVNAYATVKELPKLRIRYEAVIPYHG